MQYFCGISYDHAYKLLRVLSTLDILGLYYPKSRFNVACDTFQEEVLREAGEEVLKLGILVVAENLIENVGSYRFLNTMIQQFLAANYLLTLKTKEKVHIILVH